MEAGLDSSGNGNPFAVNGGGGNAENIISQKAVDGLLLNLTDNFKQNGSDLSPGSEFCVKDKPNGRQFDGSEGDDFGPETDVDAVDDVASPTEKADKRFGDVFGDASPSEGVYNPFMEHQEKAALEVERELRKRSEEDGEEAGFAREETPTPPADEVHDVGGLIVDNAAESDSEEDEWNYIKGDEASADGQGKAKAEEKVESKEKEGTAVDVATQPQPVDRVPEEEEEDDDDAMSQLNPNAAEFVPVSPTRSIPSPACRNLIDDRVLAQSPKGPAKDIDIHLPNAKDFEIEVKSRPSEVDSYSNGHDESSHDLMENLLNGKNIDEIPEFQPGSTPGKTQDEFHFGPNAAPFTPTKLFDRSEAGLSTRALFGDESVATLNDSVDDLQEQERNLLNKESDPMSMSFYADKGDANPFDLNEIQILPDNIDEFLKKTDVSDSNPFDDTISDLPDHYPVGKENIEPLNNDDAIVQVTDLDKRPYDDEKELASPLEEQEPSSKTPEPTHENLLDFCSLPEKSDEFRKDLLPEDVELLPNASQIQLAPEPVDLPPDVELISPEELSRPKSKTPEALGEFESKSPLPEALEAKDLMSEGSAPSPLPEALRIESPLDDLKIQEQCEKHELIGESETDFKAEAEERYDNFKFESFESKTETSRNNVEIIESSFEHFESNSENFTKEQAEKDNEPEIETKQNDGLDTFLEVSKSPISDLNVSESPLPEETLPLSPTQERDRSFTSPEALEQNQEHFEQIWTKPVEEIPQAYSEHAEPNADFKEQISFGLELNGIEKVEEIDVKTETISPEYAEQAVVTPSEESKQDDIPVPVAPLIEEQTTEPEEIAKEMVEEIKEKVEDVKKVEEVGEIIKEVEQKVEDVKESPIVEEKLEANDDKGSDANKAAFGATVAAAAAVATAAIVSKAEDKKKTAAGAKKLSGVASKTTSAAKTTASRLSASPTKTAKTTPGKPAPISKPTGSLASKASPRPRTAPAVPKTADKKPLTNGEVKTTARSALSIRRPTESVARKTTEATAAKAAAPRPITASARLTATSKPPATKASPTPRPAAAPRTTLASKPSATAPKARPAATGLAGKTTTTTTKTTLSKPFSTTSRTSALTAPKPRPATTTTASAPAPKPRVPLSSRTTSKTPDSEKQSKESANKLTASRTATARPASTMSSVRRIESKTSAPRTAYSKTSTTTLKSTAKKPVEIIRSKTTKTTKIEKPKENGVRSTVVAEEITTIVSNSVSAMAESELLLKDNSPTDNKLITEAQPLAAAD